MYFFESIYPLHNNIAMKRLLLSVMLLLAFCMVDARPIQQSEALRLATQFMKKWTKNNNVKLDFIANSSDLIKKINSYSQTSDLITNLSVFSHGTASNIAFGYENTGYE